MSESGIGPGDKPSVAEITACANGQEGKEIFAQFGKQTPRHSGVPWVEFNDVRVSPTCPCIVYYYVSSENKGGRHYRLPTLILIFQHFDQQLWNEALTDLPKTLCTHFLSGVPECS